MEKSSSEAAVRGAVGGSGASGPGRGLVAGLARIGFLVPTSALLWGIQSAFLSSVLALILMDLFHATTSDVGWVLSLYNASGFAFSFLIPAYADRRKNYLVPMLGCAALTGGFAVLLGVVTTLPAAAVALVLVAGPASVGNSLLYAHLRHHGASTADVVNTRAIFSVAWVAGPPLATVIIGWAGPRGVLWTLAVVALLGMATTAALIRKTRAASHTSDTRQATTDKPAAAGPVPVSRVMVVLVTAAFVLLQAANTTAVSIMTVYVTDTMHRPVIWSGIALGVAAALEVPALVLIGRVSRSHSALGLIATSCLAGIGYYAGLMAVHTAFLLIALQVLNAWSYAGVSGIGLSLFQDMIPRPGLSTGLYMNTRRIGAIVSGPMIALGAFAPLHQRGIFLACAVVTLGALLVIATAHHTTTRRSSSPNP